MAKSQSRSRRPHPPQAEQEPQEIKETSKPTATAVAEQPAPPARPAPQQQSSGGEDVAVIDAETNAKYEQVKGGKLYIKDLQQMDIHRPARDRQAGKHPGLHRPEEAGSDLPDPPQPHPPERPDVRRRRAGNPARRLRLPPQPGIQLSALPGRHLHQPERRSAASACATGMWCRARFVRPRNPNGISRCFASKRSTAKTPSASPTPATSKTSRRCIRIKRLDPRSAIRRI